MIKINSQIHVSDSGFGNKLFLSCFAECYAIKTKQKLFNWLATDILRAGRWARGAGVSKKDNVNIEWKHLDVDIGDQECSIVGEGTTLSTNSFHQSPDDIALMKKYKNLVVEDFGRRDGVFVHVRAARLRSDHVPSVEYYKSCLRDSFFGYLSSDDPEDDRVKYLLDNFNLKLYEETPEKTIIFASMFEHKVLSLGAFSWWIGFIGNQNNVMCPYPKDYQIWHGEIFEPMTEWNMIRKPYEKNN
tara:strand:- start:29 stop:760 length:732 start_codon:yes stop_codon:yes gene_type:complete